MTTLGCNVNSCTHNKDNCCCLNSIQVQGENACRCDDTCCESFYELDRESPQNLNESPKTILSVACDATNCVFNEDKVCSADHISISGVCASSSCETVCASFQHK
ncbi:MAG: DUF1540 domain-containing protein [Lachnospira sp.]